MQWIDTVNAKSNHSGRLKNTRPPEQQQDQLEDCVDLLFVTSFYLNMQSTCTIQQCTILLHLASDASV